jgi:hypothetical protein
MNTIYVTFAVPHLFQQDEKFAVKCDDMEQAREVGQDAYSLDGIKNVRIRKCGKPRNREIMPYDNYWEHKWY